MPVFILHFAYDIIKAADYALANAININIGNTCFTSTAL
jgi:hypothetical protein